MASEPSAAPTWPDDAPQRPPAHGPTTGDAVPVHVHTPVADTLAYRSLPPRRRTAWEWVVEYNPFYLLSAVSMLLGCLLLSNTTTWQPVPLSTLLPLLGTLQVYELACLGIGLLLYRRLGPRRDAVQLLGLVLLFAVDVSFLMSEIATQHVLTGTAVALALFALAMLKAAAIVRVLKLQIEPACLTTGMAGLLALYLVPPLLAAVDDGRGGVEVLHFYALWWAIGLSPLIFDAARRWLGNTPPTEHRRSGRVASGLPATAWTHQPPDADAHAASGTPEGAGAAFGRRPSRWLTLIAVLPWASLAVHAGVLHYVYDRPFMAPLAAPLLIGLALLIRPATATFEAMMTRTVLCAAAAVASLTDPARLSFELPRVEVTLGSAVIGGAAAWLAFAYVNAPRLLPHFAGIGLLAVLLAWFGPTLQQIAGACRWLANVAHEAAAALVPKTRAAWGLVAVCLAFMFLALGALVSFGRRRAAPERR